MRTKKNPTSKQKIYDSINDTNGNTMTWRSSPIWSTVARFVVQNDILKFPDNLSLYLAITCISEKQSAVLHKRHSLVKNSRLYLTFYTIREMHYVANLVVINL